jgi:hypothetical protein
VPAHPVVGDDEVSVAWTASTARIVRCSSWLKRAPFLAWVM